jgi:hypothetical protein
MPRTIWVQSAVVASVVTLVSASSSLGQQRPRPATTNLEKNPTTRDGRPDFHGNWTNATATMLERPDEYANRAFLTEDEADAYEKTAIERLVKAIPEGDVVTAADLDETFLETHQFKMVEGRRTSLVVDPPDGRLPPLKPEAKKRAEARPAHGYDDPETLDLDERCLLETAFDSSNASPPMVPNPFGGNVYQFVQTRDHLMIYTEVVHDARVIRIGGEHVSPTVQKWLGDSIAHWEGDTLVVDTTNFTPKSHFKGSGERLHVVERFTRAAKGIGYRVTVEDLETWDRPWTADIPFIADNHLMYEYACHEANYAVEMSLRGARADEKVAKKTKDR